MLYVLNSHIRNCLNSTWILVICNIKPIDHLVEIFICMLLFYITFCFKNSFCFLPCFFPSIFGIQISEYFFYLFTKSSSISISTTI